MGISYYKWLKYVHCSLSKQYSVSYQHGCIHVNNDGKICSFCNKNSKIVGVLLKSNPCVESHSRSFKTHETSENALNLVASPKGTIR